MEDQMPATSERSRKKAVNVSINADLAAEAKAAGLNVSGVLEKALHAELQALREQQWREENREAIEESNRYFEEHGSPLDKYRVW
jgi:antitoxin CcdA